MRVRLAFLSVALVALLVFVTLAVGHADPPRVRRTLDDCLSQAERSYPGIEAARHKILASEAQLREAWVAPFLNFNGTGFLSFAPQARGNPTFSPDAFGQSPFEGGYGYMARANLETGLPISPWTWMRFASVRDLARQGVRGSEGELARSRLELRSNLRKAYYAVLFARDAAYLLGRARGYLGDVERQVREGLDAGTGSYTQVDSLRTRVYSGELRVREGQVRQAERSALAALGMLTGFGTEVDVIDQPLCAVGSAMLPLSHYLSAARLHRPEVGMLRAGVAARRAAVSIQRGAYLPDLALGLSAAYASSSSIAAQANPFAANNANFAFWGTGLVLRWNFDPLANNQRIQRMQEELAMTEAQERQALGAIALEVESGYEAAREADNRVRSYTDTEEAAYAWFTAVFQEYQSGVGDSGGVLDPLRQYLTQRYNHLQAIFDYNAARAALALSTGSDRLAGSPECPADPVGSETPQGVSDQGPTVDEINRLLIGLGVGSDAGTEATGDAAHDAPGGDVRRGH